MAKSTSDQIIKALNNKDSAALKSMFSVNAKKNAKDLDAGIDYIMQHYEGKSISVEDNLGSTDEDIEYGTVNMRSIDWDYTIKTDKNIYSLQFVDQYSQILKMIMDFFKYMLPRNMMMTVDLSSGLDIMIPPEFCGTEC
jgi:hypothetical protein